MVIVHYGFTNLQSESSEVWQQPICGQVLFADNRLQASHL